MNKKAIMIVSICCAVAIAIAAFFMVWAVIGSGEDSRKSSKSKKEYDDDDFDTDNKKSKKSGKNKKADDDDIEDYDDEEYGYGDYDNGSDYDGEVVTLVPVILTDNLGIAAFYTFVPEGWSATINTAYTVDQNHPLQSDVILKSPDGKYLIEMVTPMNYREENNQDGNWTADDGSHDIMKYSTLLHYRTASEYIDYIAPGAGINWNAYEEHAGDSQAIGSYKQNMKKLGEDTVYFLQDAANKSGGQKFNYRYSLVNYDAEIVSRKGMVIIGNSSYIMEMTVCEGMYSYRLDYDIPNNLMVYKGFNDVTYWGTGGTYIYMSDTEENFDKYYDIAQFIINNSGTTSMYGACKQAILDYIIPKIIEANMQMQDYANQMVQEVCNSYSDTNERVSQMWDDYILDQDRYTMSDGTQIVVPSTADYVYYDGENVIWTDSPGFNPGAGYEQIN